jgi:hypothetical protein
MRFFAAFTSPFVRKASCQTSARPSTKPAVSVNPAVAAELVKFVTKAKWLPLKASIEAGELIR